MSRFYQPDEHNTKIMSASFIKTDCPEIHQQRRKELLSKYPEIRALFGIEKTTKYCVLILLLIQFILACYAQRLEWYWWLVVVYFMGATISHSLFAAIHEITHHLAFKSKFANRVFAILCNLLLGIPMAIGFEKYHFIHHRFLGDAQKDVDIPFALEARCFDSRMGKLLWLFIQPFFYAIRPFIKLPQKISLWEWSNIILQILFDVLVVMLFGWQFLAFLMVSSLFAMSIHPTAAHTVSEHYVVSKQQETYSYYGLLNYLLFNVGYHVEHHDFPNIPWSRVSKLKKIAPEYYNTLYAHRSWVWLIGQFIFSKNINLFLRVVRQETEVE